MLLETQADAERFLSLVEGERAAAFDLLVCEAVARGEGLRELAERMEVPYLRLYTWFHADEGRRAAYENALRAHAEDLAMQVVPISDKATRSTIEQAKLRVASRLRMAGYWHPNRYNRKPDGDGDSSVRVVVMRFDENGQNAVESGQNPAEIGNNIGKTALIEAVPAPEIDIFEE
ncbi:MAG: hypothetical protein FJX68_12725 [Alphaproteobacteria bacterium]|nr:hypothetical protein [Alphaproteobacteria bacterium]